MYILLLQSLLLQLNFFQELFPSNNKKNTILFVTLMKRQIKMKIKMNLKGEVERLKVNFKMVN